MEDLALRILAMHTGKLPHALLAGAEWWANVSRSDTMDRVDGYGDIGFHFDKDEAIYGTHGLIIHPLLSTVTYLSDDGAPTVVLPMGRITPTGEYTVDKLPEAIVVPPRVGRHVCFDGRWTILACPPVPLESSEPHSGSEAPPWIARCNLTFTMPCTDFYMARPSRSYPNLPRLAASFLTNVSLSASMYG